MTTTTTTTAAVQRWLSYRRSRSDWHIGLEPAAAAAIRLAELLDQAPTAQSAAHASRELRQVLAQLAPIDDEHDDLVTDLVDRRRRRLGDQP